MKKFRLFLAAVIASTFVSVSAQAGTVLTYFYYSNGVNVGVATYYIGCDGIGAGPYVYGEVTSNFTLDVQSC